MDEIFLYLPIGIFLGIMVGILITSPDISLVIAFIGDVVLAVIAYIYSSTSIFGFGIGLIIGFFIGLAIGIFILKRRDYKLGDHRTVSFSIAILPIIVALIIIIVLNLIL